VTLFGVVDANVRWTDNDGGDLWSLSTDGLSSSRLGFRGTEDLGGGLKAGFWLEAALNPDTGTTQARFWHRRATVSLISDALGELRLGRDYTATFWNLTEFDPFGTNGVGASTNLFPGNVGVQAVDTLVRADNVVGYFLPGNLGGVYGQAQYAFGEGDAAVNRNNQSAHGRIGYKAGPFNAAVSYGQTWTVGPDRLTALNVGASWDFGFMQLMGQYAQLALGDEIQDLDRTNYLVGLNFPIGAGLIRASYIYSDFNNDGPACPATIGTTTAPTNCDNAQMFNLGYVHNLSKRTALYTTVSLIDNDDNAAITHTPSRTQAIGEKSTAFEVGMRHAF
jgi:predicted porin